MNNMTVSQLKNIIAELPDDMSVIIPVIDEDDCNRIFGFRHVRTAGILVDDYAEKDNKVLCLNAATDEKDIADQVYFSGKEVSVEKILYGTSKYEKEKEND